MGIEWALPAADAGQSYQECSVVDHWLVVLKTGPASGCGNGAYDKQLAFTHDWTGNMTSAGDGSGTTASYSYTPASEVLSITSSVSGITYPSSLVTNVQNAVSGPQSYWLGNGLSQWYSYDALGRVQNGSTCTGAPSYACGGTGSLYTFSDVPHGTQMQAAYDQNIGNVSFGYDEFNRITSTNVNNGQWTFSYVYDRYGNRWQQNAPQGGPAPQYLVNTSNNQIAGFAYDAAGNMTSDGIYTYTYDADGHITQVDGGNIASYRYNALNQRIRVDTPSSSQEFVFNAAGQRASRWDGNSHAQIQGQYYWGSKPIAFYSGGAIHFQHQDWMGTERIRTDYTGNVEGSYISAVYGDWFIPGGSDLDAYHYAGLDNDPDGREHAQFRQYSSTQGRFLSPDPYGGSMDFNNPQSLNRYSYVLICTEQPTRVRRSNGNRNHALPKRLLFYVYIRHPDV